MGMTMREKELLESYNKFMNKKVISMNELDGVFYQIEKLLMNYKDARESRDKLKLQVKDLKDQLREFKNVK